MDIEEGIALVAAKSLPGVRDALDGGVEKITALVKSGCTQELFSFVVAKVFGAPPWRGVDLEGCLADIDCASPRGGIIAALWADGVAPFERLAKFYTSAKILSRQWRGQAPATEVPIFVVRSQRCTIEPAFLQLEDVGHAVLYDAIIAKVVADALQKYAPTETKWKTLSIDTSVKKETKLKPASSEAGSGVGFKACAGSKACAGGDFLALCSRARDPAASSASSGATLFSYFSEPIPSRPANEQKQ